MPGQYTIPVLTQLDAGAVLGRSQRLTDADVLAMRSMHAQGKVAKQVWAVFPHVSLAHVHDVLNGRRRAGVKGKGDRVARKQQRG